MIASHLLRGLGTLLCVICFIAVGCNNSTDTATTEPESQPIASSPASSQNENATESEEQSSGIEVQPEASVTGSESVAGKAGESKTDRAAAKSKMAPKISSEAFRMAAYEGKLDTVRSAVEAGADINGIDPAQSLTALHMAAYNGHTETVNFLIEKGATVDCRDSEGKTPLIHACTGPFAQAVEALLAAGADINARDKTEGFTPLMMAAGLGQVDVVKVLLKNNADKSLLDQDKESASDHARNSGHKAIVEMLAD